jgi:hypothetical protein
MSKFPTALTADDVKTIHSMTPEELVLHAQTLDLAVVVESSLRLDATTKRLNSILIWLTGALLVFTVAICALTVVLVCQGWVRATAQ